MAGMIQFPGAGHQSLGAVANWPYDLGNLRFLAGQVMAFEEEPVLHVGPSPRCKF